MVIDAGDGVRHREGAGLNRRAEVVGRPHSAGSADGLRLGGDARGTAFRSLQTSSRSSVRSSVLRLLHTLAHPPSGLGWSEAAGVH